MKLINESPPLKVQLARNLVKVIKRGHAWVYADALRNIPQVVPGTPALLLDNRGGREIARGYLDPTNPIAFRVCATQPGLTVTSEWAERTMQRALKLRQALFSPYQNTNAYRLFNGEGDGLPGLVCDIYDHTAVLVTDGPAPENFWLVDQIAQWVSDNLGIELIFHKSRSQHLSQTVQILGPETDPIFHFLENGFSFTANLVSGQKTGFFLDQRDNRALILQLSQGKTVLNVFGYTGGFSVYAGKGGAQQVTTVDIAEPALQEAAWHWQYNHLPKDRHSAVCADAFEYLHQAVQQQKKWDLVILDPPSFASSEANVPQAEKAYSQLITLGAQAVAPTGILAAASCSSHIQQNHFLKIIEESLSAARRRATVLGIFGQPPDHPFPLAMPELRYLKFVLLQLD